jgi:pimeloyl-ACP methyl ester carboxylesterase
MAASELHYIEANGLRFAYFAEGQGPLVLLLHGFPDTAHSWDHVRPLIAAKGYRAVSPFMRGYRPTAIPERDADSETLGRDALALIEALGEPSAVIVAHDWGASGAYAAAALEPARVSKLAVIAIPHPATLRPTPAKLWGVRHFAAYKLRGAPARFAKNDFAALRDIYRRWSPKWDLPEAELTPVRECFADPASLNAAFGYYRTLSLRLPACFKTPITVPTIVFAGLDDPVAKPADYRNAKRMFSGAYTVEEMPGGHFLHREHPDLFAKRLLAHL